MGEIFTDGFYENILDMIHMNVFVSDVETDEILYMNAYMKETFHLTEPEGKPCRQVLRRGMKERCASCRISGRVGGGEGRP